MSSSTPTTLYVLAPPINKPEEPPSPFKKRDLIPRMNLSRSELTDRGSVTSTSSSQQASSPRNFSRPIRSPRSQRQSLVGDESASDSDDAILSGYEVTTSIVRSRSLNRAQAAKVPVDTRVRRGSKDSTGSSLHVQLKSEGVPRSPTMPLNIPIPPEPEEPFTPSPRRTKSVGATSSRRKRQKSVSGNGTSTPRTTTPKAPAGTPPWISPYTPSPHLPPEQQLLPTVAKRLERERFEREMAEGKHSFVTVWDKDGQPLLRRPSEMEEDEQRQRILEAEMLAYGAMLTPGEVVGIRDLGHPPSTVGAGDVNDVIDTYLGTDEQTVGYEQGHGLDGGIVLLPTPPVSAYATAASEQQPIQILPAQEVISESTSYTQSLTHAGQPVATAEPYMRHLTTPLGVEPIQLATAEEMHVVESPLPSPPITRTSFPGPEVSTQTEPFGRRRKPMVAVGSRHGSSEYRESGGESSTKSGNRTNGTGQRVFSPEQQLEMESEEMGASRRSAGVGTTIIPPESVARLGPMQVFDKVEEPRLAPRVEKRVSSKPPPAKDERTGSKCCVLM
ncbi:hypothetical protein YB2330_004894 [Saitoella coloradoensis]